MDEVRPFLRWAGGKRWLAKKLAPLIKKRLKEGSRYIEPFLGSGAMFFSIQPDKAILSDLNENLINTFCQVRNNPDDLIAKLIKIPANKDKYYSIRDWNPRTHINKAVRFIYLNRNCYGGLYRENRKGEFNVPYGGNERNHFKICQNGTIINASKQLNLSGVQIKHCDFEEIINSSSKGDVVFCDPTYRKINRDQFDRYGRIKFTWEDQKRLSKVSIEAYNRGVVVIVSNSFSADTKELYDYGIHLEISRPKGLGKSLNSKRQKESLFIYDPCKRNDFWKDLV